MSAYQSVQKVMGRTALAAVLAASLVPAGAGPAWGAETPSVSAEGAPLSPTADVPSAETLIAEGYTQFQDTPIYWKRPASNKRKLCITSVAPCALPDNFAAQADLTYEVINVVEIDGSISRIGSGAFKNMSALMGVTVTAPVTTVGAEAFSGCSGLLKMTLPDTVTEIEDGAFAYCAKLATCPLPENLTSIGTQAFLRTAMTSLALPESLKTIGSFAFAQMYSLDSVVVPSSVVDAGSGMFQSCSGMTAADLSATSLPALPSDTFSGCTKLTAVKLPATLKTVGASAFSNCKLLSTVSLPDSVEEIGQMAFVQCAGLRSLNAAGQWAFQLPASLRSIGASAFDGCQQMASVYIPDSVGSIGSSAFAGCSVLTKLRLPKNIQPLGLGAFTGCARLSEVTTGEVAGLHGVTDAQGTALQWLSNNVFSSASIDALGVSPHVPTAAGTDEEAVPYHFHDGVCSFTCVTCGSEITYEAGVASLKAGEAYTALTGCAREAGCTLRQAFDLQVQQVTGPTPYVGPYIATGAELSYELSVPEAEGELHLMLADGTFADDGALEMAPDGATVVLRTAYVGPLAWVTEGIDPDDSDDPVVPEPIVPEPEAPVAPVAPAPPATPATPAKPAAPTAPAKPAAPVPVSLARAKVTLSAASKTYTGKALKPSVKVTYGGKTLKAGTDYTLTYASNKAIGKATITVKGKGAYTGTVKKTFKIVPKKVAAKKAVSTKKKRATVSWAKGAAAQKLTGYQVRYSTSKKFTAKTTKTKTVKGRTKTSCTLTGLKSGKTYYVQVRAYKTVGGVKYVGAWSGKVLKVKVR